MEVEEVVEIQRHCLAIAVAIVEVVVVVVVVAVVEDLVQQRPIYLET